MTSEDQGENTLLEQKKKKATSCSVVKNKESNVPETPESSERSDEASPRSWTLQIHTRVQTV